MERIYLRGSDERINTDNQLIELRAVSPDGVLYKDVRSGSRKRPELERLIADCQPGDLVIIWSIDRLTREGTHATLDYIKRITARGANVRSLREDWLDSQRNAMCWEIMVSCMATAAKIERGRMIERTVAGIRRARAQAGKPVLDKAKIAAAEGSLRVVGKKFGCTAPYVLRCRQQAAAAAL